MLGNENNTASLYQSQAAWNSCSLTPFFDTTLVEYLGQLPDGFKRSSTADQANPARLRGHRPRKDHEASKMGFGVPLVIWFRGDLRGCLADMLASGARLYDYLQPPVVKCLYEHLASRADHDMKLLTLEVWPFASDSGLQEGDS